MWNTKPCLYCIFISWYRINQEYCSFHTRMVNESVCFVENPTVINKMMLVIPWLLELDLRFFINSWHITHLREHSFHESLPVSSCFFRGIKGIHGQIVTTRCHFWGLLGLATGQNKSTEVHSEYSSIKYVFLFSWWKPAKVLYKSYCLTPCTPGKCTSIFECEIFRGAVIITCVSISKAIAFRCIEQDPAGDISQHWLR